jgi:hypothetical protein
LGDFQFASRYLRKKKMTKSSNYQSLNRRYYEMVVEQKSEGMVIISRHQVYAIAKKKAEKLAESSKGTIFAALSLIGNPRRNYKVGDVLDPRDVQWVIVPNRCSECCDNCQIKSLEYRCPITAGNPLCDTVAASIIVFKVE